MTDPSQSRVNRRIRWLVIAHLILAAGPLAYSVNACQDAWALPLQWAVFAIPLGGLMTLSIWLGMGGVSAIRRVTLAVAASLYITFFQHLAMTAPLASFWKAEWLLDYLEEALPMAIFVLVCGGMFFSIRRWYTLERIDPADPPQKPERLQFSMFQIILTMSAVAILLSLQRSAIAAANAVVESFWVTLGTYAFVFGIFLLNTVCSALAVLSVGPIRRNVSLTFFISALLGLAMAFGWKQDDTPWWLFLNYILMPMFPTAVVVLSLLVVRSTGYRLAKRTASRPVTDAVIPGSA